MTKKEQKIKEKILECIKLFTAPTLSDLYLYQDSDVSFEEFMISLSKLYKGGKIIAIENDLPNENNQGARRNENRLHTL